MKRSWRKRRRKSESRFQEQVIDIAEERGWRVFYVANSRGSPPGWPDLFMSRRGTLVAAELKVGDNEPTEQQQQWLAELEAGGVRACVWRYGEHVWRTIKEVLD